MEKRKLIKTAVWFAITMLFFLGCTMIPGKTANARPYEETCQIETEKDKQFGSTKTEEDPGRQREISFDKRSILGEQIAAYARQFVGVTPYVQGSYSLYAGTDCSGFLWLIFGAFGINVPAGVAPYQFYVGEHIAREDLLPGDIVVYAYGEHVALYAGDGYVIHCSCPECGTVCWNMDYRPDATAYLRVIPQ